jgi:hypothetical protein
MRDIAFLAILGGGLTVVTIVVVRFRLGKGLATWVISWTAPSLTISSMAAFILGQKGLSIPLLGMSVGIIAPIVLGCIYMLYRSVMVSIRLPITQLATGSEHLSSTAQQTAAAAEEQSSAMTQLTSTVSEMEQMTVAAIAAAEEVMKAVDWAVETGEQGAMLTEKAVQIIRRISSASRHL